MADNNDIVTRGSGEGSTITDALLHVANNSTFRDGPERKDVSDGEVGFLSTVDELTSVHTLRGDEELLLVLEAERMAESDSAERGSASGVVDDVGNDSLDVSIALRVVEGSETGRTFAAMGVGGEDGACSFSLASDDATHRC